MATVLIQKRIGKRGTSYRVQYRNPVTGKKIHYKTLSRQRDAQQAANELRSLLDSGKIPEKKVSKFNPMTFSQVAEALRNDWNSRLKREELSQKTVAEYRIWLGVLERTFGNRLLCQIGLKEILAYRDEQIERNSIVSANRYLSIFKMLFAHGMEIHGITQNPVKDIALLSEKAHERKRFLLPEELDRLIEATQKARGRFYLPAAIYLGAEHGASKQEVLSLRWSDINFDYQGKGLIRFFRTKNKRERTEFLMPRAREALLSWRNHLEWIRHRKRVSAVESDHVFCHISGTPLKRFDRSWQKTLDLAGIKDFHFHDLRHTFCSNLLLSGASLKDVKEMIGHQDISMTDRYSHLSMNHNLSKQVRLAEHYSNGETA